jgi:hypothetical protein
LLDGTPDAQPPGAGIADEVRDIGAVRALGDADPAIGALLDHATGLVQHNAFEAGRGPFPDIAGEIGEAVLVDAERAEGPGRAVVVAAGLALIAGDPAFRRIVVVDGEAVVAEFAAGSERPFGVGRQPAMLAGLAGQPGRVGLRIVPGNLHRQPVDRNGNAVLQRAAGAGIDASLIVGGADLMLHDRKRLRNAQRDQRRLGRLAGAGEIAGHAIGHGARMQLDHRRFDDRGAALNVAIGYQGNRQGKSQGDRGQRAGETGGAGKRKLELEGNQHG